MTSIFKSPVIYILIVAMLIMTFIVMIVPSPEITIPSSSGGMITIEQDASLLVANATIIEVVSGHAWEGHGTEVNDAFRCLNDKGSTMSFKTFGFKDSQGRDLFTNLWLCQDGDKWYAIITTTLNKVGGNRIGRLITAYLIDKNLFPVIDDFLALIKDKWNAVQINFVIEAGTVFLSPK